MGILSTLLGSAVYVFSLALVPGAISDNGAGLNAEARVEVRRNGSHHSFTQNGLGDSNDGNWVAPPFTTIGDNFYVRLTVTSGAISSGSTTGTWLQVNSDRTWSVTRTTVGTNTATVKIEIATDSGGTNIVATKSGIVLTATK